MKTGKTILGILFLAIVLVVILKDWSCNRPAVATSAIDSLANAARAKEDSFYRVNVELERRLMDANYENAQKSAAVDRALAIIKPTTEKLRVAIAANAELKRRNDTLERLNNCDTLAWYSGLQSDQLDLLRDSLQHERQAARDIITIQDAAIDAANAKALEMTRQRDQFEVLLRKAATAAQPVKDDRFSIGLQTGYGLSGSGTSPYIGVGIQFKILNIKIPNKRKSTVFEPLKYQSNDTLPVFHLARGLD